MSSLKPRFTDTQGQYLAFIDAYTRVNGRPPAETDLQRHFQVSPPSMHQMVLALERVGLIRRQPGVARSIEVLVAPEYLPVFRHPPTCQILWVKDLADDPSRAFAHTYGRTSAQQHLGSS